MELAGVTALPYGEFLFFGQKDSDVSAAVTFRPSVFPSFPRLPVVRRYAAKLPRDRTSVKAGSAIASHFVASLRKRLRFLMPPVTGIT